MPNSCLHRLTALFLGVFLAFSMVAVDLAEARRGGGFGSRGSRTFQPAPITRTAPKPVAPVERSMTPNPGPTNPAARNQAAPRPGLNSGFFGGSLFRGLMLGGLIGLFLGHGFGGMAGFLGLLVQLLLIGGLAWLALRVFRGAAQPAQAMASGGRSPSMSRRDSSARAGGSFAVPRMGSALPNTSASSEIKLVQADLDAFERQLIKVQEAFASEDHSALGRYATPEMVSYLSEELADNAKRGLRNEVSDVRLLQADIAESWREGNEEYATAAMRYAARDVMRERSSGRVVGGSDAPTETTELWTFTRRDGGGWKLSAIQGA